VTTEPPQEPHPLALLSHELRTPLNAVIGYADAMRGEAFGPLPTAYKHQAAIIHAAALHLLALVNDMTDIARADAGVWAGEPQRFSVTAAAHAIVTLLAPRAAEAGVAIRTEIDDGLGDVRADRRAIVQILINLIDNALKFTPRGGEIVVVLAGEGRDLRLEVADSAPGEAVRPPDAGEGSGLGLSLARSLCRLHGGALTFERRRGIGATVEVRLPVLVEA